MHNIIYLKLASFCSLLVHFLKLNLEAEVERKHKSLLLFETLQYNISTLFYHESKYWVRERVIHSLNRNQIIVKK